MNFLTIARRDLAAYLHGYTGYAVIAAVLFIDGLLFNAFALGGGAKYSHDVLQNFFYFSSGLTVAASVLLTMRVIAEERTEGTDVLLQTSVVSDLQVVFGKYVAAMTMICILTALTLYMPAMIFVNGKVSWAHVGVGYLGVLSLASATTAIGIFGSALFRSQVAAAIVSAVLVGTFYTTWMLSQVTDPPFSDITAYMAMFDKHFIPFMEGQLVTSGLVYYGSVTFVFLLLTSKILEGRRWE